MTSNRSILVVSALIAPVLLAGCVSQSKYDELQAQNQQLQSQNQQLQSQMAAARSQVGRLQGAIKYTVNSDLLFASGSWEMSKAGQDVIAKIAPKLAPAQQSPLIVYGYTDNAPVGKELKRRGVDSNLELSQKRADAVMQFLITQNVRPDMISAKGMGDADPIAPNTSAQGRAQNRRVEIAIAPSGS